jgi:anti-sigma B factor antagonist
MDTRSGGLELRQDGDRSCVRLVLAGELDMASAKRLQEAVTRACDDGAKELTLDLARLAFVDSSGLAAIVYASWQCERAGCELALVPGRASVQRVFDVTGLAEHLPFAAADGAGGRHG